MRERMSDTMNRVAIVTDSNSGITQTEALSLGISVIPMPFYINETLYYEDITLTREEFYLHLQEDAEISTSQPSPGDVLDLWDKLLEEYDEIVYLPMSSGLSSSCSTAIMLAEDYDGKVEVVNNQRISVTLRQSVLDAINLAEKGKSAAEIKQILEQTKFDSSIYITLETLHYLKKGGRITPAAAAIGTMLNLKPVLTIQGEKLDAYSKTRGKKAARSTMMEAMRNDMERRWPEAFASGHIKLFIAYSNNLEEALEWKNELLEAFPTCSVQELPLSLSVSCHTGPGAMGFACTVDLPEDI